MARPAVARADDALLGLGGDRVVYLRADRAVVDLLEVADVAHGVGIGLDSGDGVVGVKRALALQHDVVGADLERLDRLRPVAGGAAVRDLNLTLPPERASTALA